VGVDECSWDCPNQKTKRGVFDMQNFEVDDDLSHHQVDHHIEQEYLVLARFDDELRRRYCWCRHPERNDVVR
jgi:hypothetical protein